ncbi:hypothetical protein BG004_006072 [Podila humilis]|nr:hypothetical protein BG004_006072 [Podila humilis]
MPPKKRPADDAPGGDDARKRVATTVSGAKSVSITAPGVSAAAAKPTGARPGPHAAGTSKPGTVRGTPKPGVRKVNAAAAAGRAKAVASATAAAAKKDAAPPMIVKNTLMWFRTDLRLQDNRALYAAAAKARAAGTNVLGLYIITEQEWQDQKVAPVKIDFWIRNLHKLSKELEKLSIPLIVKKLGGVSEVLGAIESVITEHDVSHVFWNAEYTTSEEKRDSSVKDALKKKPFVSIEVIEDKCVISPKEIKTKIGTPFSVFEKFKMTWLVQVETQPSLLKLSPVPDANPEGAKTEYAKYFGADIPTSHPHDLNQDQEAIERFYPAGEDAAHQRLKTFIDVSILDYHHTRDLVQQEGANPLAAYIANGILSHRQCITMARSVNNNKVMVGNEGVKNWVTEFIWKEFFQHVMVSFPRVRSNQSYLASAEEIRWTNDERKFTLWCQGKTGYPIVDAGMRQLNSVGYMNKRARKIAMCFLVKDLMVNWQKGEKYFMSHLIDGDVAVVNGLWQWCAGTGVDAQPYYTSNNPLIQSQKCDPFGEYIREWVPELEDLLEHQLHDPFHTLPAKDFGKLGYPRPMVDHLEAKKKFAEEFKRVLGSK